MNNNYKAKRRKYLQHRANAKGRGILWLFNYITWIKIWYESGRWEERGCRKGQYDPDTRKKISNALKGRSFSKEHRLNLSVSATGRKHTELTKSKMSLSRMGRKISDEHKHRLKEGYERWQNNQRCIN